MSATPTVVITHRLINVLIVWPLQSPHLAKPGRYLLPLELPGPATRARVAPAPL